MLAHKMVESLTFFIINQRTEYPCLENELQLHSSNTKKKKNSVDRVCDRTILVERTPIYTLYLISEFEYVSLYDDWAKGRITGIRI